MTGAVLLLMKEPEAAFCRDLLLQQAPSLDIRHADDRDSLSRLADRAPAGSRLIAFSTQVVVPPDILARLNHDAYNFHPGPPTYPGSKPSAFAVYEGARRFGVTLHRMIARVDAGEIVATDWFDILPGIRAAALAAEAYGRLARLFAAHAGALATLGRPLPANGEQWRGPTRTQAQYERLRQIDGTMSQAECARRFQACDGIYSPLPAPPDSPGVGAPAPTASSRSPS